MNFGRLICAAAALCLFGARQAAGAAEAPSWLDRSPPAAWNKPAAAIPRRAPGPVENGARCASNVRRATSLEDQRIAAAGWRLVGAYLRFDGTSIVEAASGFDGMCRWAGYNAFVFVDGTYAGTLSPTPMDALIDVHLYSAGAISGTFSRYTPDDPLCCPTRTSSATYSLQGKGKLTVVTASGVSTSANPK